MTKQLAPFAPIAAAAIFLLVATPGIARATPTAYNESSGGDLPDDFGFPFTFFTFDTGTNTVSGVSGVTFGNADFDSFAFTVPSGLRVTGGSLVINNLTGTVSSLGWRLGQGSVDSMGGNLVAFVGGIPPSTTALPALDADNYNVTATGIGGSLDRTASYTFSFVVAPVPEPASLCLLALPTLLLGRRVQRARQVRKT